MAFLHEVHIAFVIELWEDFDMLFAELCPEVADEGDVVVCAGGGVADEEAEDDGAFRAFDELLERARFIVEQEPQPSQ